LQIAGDARIGNGDEAQSRVLDLSLEQACHNYLYTIGNFLRTM